MLFSFFQQIFPLNPSYILHNICYRSHRKKKTPQPTTQLHFLTNASAAKHLACREPRRSFRNPNGDIMGHASKPNYPTFILVYAAAPLRLHMQMGIKKSARHANVRRGGGYRPTNDAEKGPWDLGSPL